MWTPDEDDVIRVYYPTQGRLWSGWEYLMPDRSIRAIAQRASKLGVQVAPQVKSRNCSVGRIESIKKASLEWTESELDILRQHYARRGPSWSGWATLLPNRTKGAIRSKANDIGVTKTHKRKSRSFTEAESKRILKTTIKLASSMGADPYDVAMEIVRLGDEYERQRTND